MRQYNAKNIRNVAFVGHSGTGKTSLAEAMLFLSGASDRLGRIADGTTICDFDAEEIKRKATVLMAIAPIEWKNTKMNILDTPGLFDFSGGLNEGMRAAGSAVITISGKNGIAVGSEKGFKAASKKGISKIFFVNEMDNENSDFYKVFEELKAHFGPMICPLVVPFVENRKVQCYINLLEYKAYIYKDGKSIQVPIPEMGHRLEGLRTAMNEAVAETSEELMEKYFSGEDFTPDELINGLASGVRRGEIAPVFCGSAYTLEGVDQLMNGLIWLAPYAETMAGESGKDADGKDVALKVDDNDPTAVIVFKTIVDPFVGKLLYFKVVSGTVKPDTTLLNMRTGSTEKIGKVYMVRGKKQQEVPYICAGDIGAVSKLANTNTGDTLSSSTRPVILPGVSFDAPHLSMSVHAKNKADEEKISAGLSRLMEEDPTIGYYHNHETHERILSGLGEQHLDVVVSKLKSKFGVDVTLDVPKVPYRETIRKKVKVQGRHKKQSGGHGQFGDVWIEFEPGTNDELEFNETVFGGSVPKNFFPAVEKGLIEACRKGTLAGFPMVGLKATLVDGSYHPVDSSEMAFKLAAALAYKTGIPQANPVLLEPVGSLKAYVPNDNTGDVMGDINKRRGRVLGMVPSEEDNLTCVEAEVPMAEMGDFSTLLRSLTQGRGHFKFEFVRYEEAPQPVAQKVIEANKVEED
ncbi:MAG TPA: elongation factor G [Ruminococcaceae bacterium]|nr:elongation factor G [Oscillospiraceae bacterium]